MEHSAWGSGTHTSAWPTCLRSSLQRHRHPMCPRVRSQSARDEIQFEWVPGATEWLSHPQALLRRPSHRGGQVLSSKLHRRVSCLLIDEFNPLAFI